MSSWQRTRPSPAWLSSSKLFCRGCERLSISQPAVGGLCTPRSPQQINQFGLRSIAEPLYFNSNGKRGILISYESLCGRLECHIEVMYDLVAAFG